MVDSQRSCRISLRIEVHYEYRKPAERECGRQVDTARGLADAALLISDNEDPGDRRRRKRGGCHGGCGRNGRRIFLDHR